MSATTARRLIQLGCVMLLETLFFLAVPSPLLVRLAVGAACAVLLTRHWRRTENPKPRRSRKRVGPPMEWID